MSTPTSSRCSTGQGVDARPCPRCEGTGPVVGHRPVRPHRPDVIEGDWQCCATAGCLVVYYLYDDVVTIDELRTQVDDKALDRPQPACFSHTVDELVDIRRPLESLIAGTAAHPRVSMIHPPGSRPSDLQRV